jgi:hypothetical protein
MLLAGGICFDSHPAFGIDSAKLRFSIRQQVRHKGSARGTDHELEMVGVDRADQFEATTEFDNLLNLTLRDMVTTGLRD